MHLGYECTPYFFLIATNVHNKKMHSVPYVTFNTAQVHVSGRQPSGAGQEGGSHCEVYTRLFARMPPD